MKKWKKYTNLLLALVMCLSLTACGDAPEETIGDTDMDIEEESNPVSDISGFTGCWKMENAPFYFVINDSYEWIAVNLYNEQIGPGYFTAEEDYITLCMEDGSAQIVLWQTDEGNLKDKDDNLLLPTDYIMLLPTPEDALNQTTYFSDNFTNVSINYPIQMEAFAQSNTLSFDAVMKDGTDDLYSNILITFQPISGYDTYMEKGAGTAESYMVKMLDQFMNNMYGDYLIKSLGSDFKDNGNYYSITGYMWIDGSIFTGNNLSQPVRGCMEVRYYGPTGYALIASTVALDSRIQNYFDICNNMLTTLSYTTGWSTAPSSLSSPPTPEIAVTMERHITGTTKTVISGTGTAMKTCSWVSARTATLTAIRANIWSQMTQVGIMKTNITMTMTMAGAIMSTSMTMAGATMSMTTIHGPIPVTVMTHGPTPATIMMIMTTAGVTTSNNRRRMKTIDVNAQFRKEDLCGKKIYFSGQGNGRICPAG